MSHRCGNRVGGEAQINGVAGNFRVSSFRASGHDLDNAMLMIHYIHLIIDKLLSEEDEASPESPISNFHFAGR